MKFDGVKTDPMADFMSALRAADDRDLAKMKDLCDDVYERFVMLVCKSRKMDIKDVEKIADGKIYTGAQALEIGLCDSIGGVESAINEAAKLAKIGGYKVVQYPKYDPISEIFRLIPQARKYWVKLRQYSARNLVSARHLSRRPQNYRGRR